MATYTSNLNLKKPASTEDVSILDINGNSDTLDTEVSTSNVYLSVTSLSALPHTISNSKITANHRVVNMILSNSLAQPSDWSYTTAAGSITITGTISGTTNVFLHLAKYY